MVAGQSGLSGEISSSLGSGTQQSWPVKQILDEWQDKFLIAWDGIDPATGKEWEPTWESKSNVSPDLRQQWDSALLLRPSQQARLPPSSYPTTNSSSRPRPQSQPSSPIRSLASSPVGTPEWKMTASSQDPAAIAARARRSSRAPSPATLESLVPDSQGELEEGEEEAQVAEGVTMVEEDDEEPSTQSVSFEGPITLSHPAAVPNSHRATAAIPTPAPLAVFSTAPVASTSHAHSPHPIQPQHIPHHSPRRSIDRAAVARAIAAVVPTVKFTGYTPPSPRPEDELISAFDSYSSGSSGSVGVGVRALPRPRSLPRPVVTMGLAGPQVLPHDGGEVLSRDSSCGYSQADAQENMPVEASPNQAQPAVLVADTPSASTPLATHPDTSAESNGLAGAGPASSSNAPLHGSRDISGASGQGAVAQGVSAAGLTVKRERTDEDEEARKRARPDAEVAVAAASAPVPAPAVSPQTLGLIKLVRESLYVSSEGQTKEEVVKFVTDPKGYASTPGAPLCSQPAWAFELRRATYDGVEKHDWILINSTEGTYFLKRTPASQQVAFANSLDHTPPRPATTSRPLSPPPVTPIASELGEAAAIPAPGVMGRDQLEAEYARLAAGLAAATAELATLRPLADELAAAQASITSLTRQNKALQSSKESISDDFNYMQAQYSSASSAALERAREAQVAEAEVAELRIKLGLGMAQRDKVMEGIEKRWKFEVKRMEGEVRLLREERRRSEVPGWQEKAGLWEAHLAREALKQEGAEAESGEEQEEEEDKPKDEVKLTPLAAGDRPRLWTRPAGQTQTQSGPTQAGTETTFGSSQAGGVGSLEVGFECEWRGEGGEACGVVVATKDELRDHVVGAHVPL